MSSVDRTGVSPGRSDLSGTSEGRFRFEELLGAGGSGQVYRATDTQLKRTVAIKRFAPSAADHSSKRNLIREAQRTSSLNHPCITSVFDVLTTDLESFLIMEYVDGQTLRERMSSPIDLHTFRSIGLQCSQALKAAHEHGVLHGDIKPANIMLTRATQAVKLCDFGLARRLPRERDDPDSVSTRDAGITGTPAYMAPEVVLEQPPDERADIFSLGVVFYEMLAGTNPFRAPSVGGTLDRVLNHRPPSLDQLDSRLPASIARLVDRMLEPDRERRLITVSDIGDELQRFEPTHAHAIRPTRRGWVTFALVAAAIVVAIVTFLAVRRPVVAPVVGTLPSEIHLAVLPFAVSGDRDRGPFSQGLADEVSARLSRITVGRGLQIASREAAGVRPGGQLATAKDARDQLGANLALIGSLLYAGDRVQVAARLVDTASEQAIRSSVFELTTADAQALRDDIVEATVDMMGLTLTAAERQVLAPPTSTKPTAYDYYLQARGYLLNYDRLDSLDNAVAVFRKALEVEPRYAPAYAGLGQAHWRKYELTNSSAWVEPARAACEGAVGMDPQLSESHICLGMVFNGTGAYDQAAKEFTRALEREPTSDRAYMGLATAYERLGRQADAEHTFQRAVEMRPNYWAVHNQLGGHYYRRGLFDQALAAFQQSVALAPDSFRGYSSIGAVHFMKDRAADAVAAFEKSLAIRPNFVAASNLGTLYFYDGQFARSAAAYRQALALEQGSYQVWSNLAGALEATGRTAEAAEAHKRTVALVEEGLRVNPRNVALQMALADARAALGDKPGSQVALNQVLRAAPTDPRTRFALAVYYESRLGNRAAALEWLTKAVAAGQPWREIDRLPTLTRLRTDDRFQELRRGRENPGK